MTSDPYIRAEHIVAGIGLADRQQLAMLLAVLEEGTVARLLESRYQAANTWVKSLFRTDTGQPVLPELRERIGAAAKVIEQSPASEAALRIRLWISLRQAFGLPPAVALSVRAAQQAAAELAASVVLADEAADGTAAPADLEHLVRTKLLALIGQALDSQGERGSPTPDERAVLDALKGYLERLDEVRLREVLDTVGAESITDEAIRKLLTTAGGLTVFAAAVASAGFSAYMLAASASAFVPLVGGAGMVSLVATLANPLTVILLVGGLGYYWYEAADRSATRGTAVTLCCLLALAGLVRREEGVRAFLESFGSLDDQTRWAGVSTPGHEAIERYRQAWNQIKDVRFRRTVLAPAVAQVLARPGVREAGGLDRMLRRAFLPEVELGQTAAIAALTIGDLVYQAAVIDPNVVRAADFVSADDLSGLEDFAVFAERIASLGGRSLVGAESNLQGYVAERIVAEKLIAQGHQVAFPEASNQQGWDLLVDGKPFQVKCVDTLDPLREHFEKYDYPVFVNSELAEQIETLAPELANRVYVVEGFSQAFTRDITERSLAAGDEVMNPDVPVFAMAVCAAREFHGWWTGQVSAEDAVAQAILRGSVRSGLAIVGGFAGKALGFLVLGPAGALVGTTAGPLVLQFCAPDVTSKVMDLIPSERRDAWAAETHTALDDVIAECTGGLDTKLEILRGKFLAVGKGVVGKYLRHRLEDDALFLSERREQAHGLSKAEIPSVDERHRQAMRWVTSTTVHPVWFQRSIARLGKLLGGRPGLGELVSDVVARVSR